MNLKEVVFKCVDFVQIPENKVHLRAVANTGAKLEFHKGRGIP